GPLGQATLLLVKEADLPAVTGYDRQPGWAAFPHSRAERPVPVRILIADGESRRQVTLPRLELAHPHVQPLHEGELLVVSARCRRFRDGTIERNAHVYTADGEIKREMVFG